MQNITSDSKVAKLQEVVNLWTERLTKAEISEAKWSVNQIVAYVHGKKNIQDVDMTSAPTGTKLSKIEEMCDERLKGTPVPYIVGEWDFLDMTLQMRQPVFIPKPTTEEFAKAILKEWPFDREREVRLLDVGCGTGALSLYVLNKIPNVTCVAMDICKPSCELTLENASRYNLQGRIEVVHGDILTDEAVSELCRRGLYDVVISNPPFLTTDEVSDLEKEVVNFDYLFGRKDGLDVVRKVIVEAEKFFKDADSVVMMKVGPWTTGRIKKFLDVRSDLKLSHTDKGRIEFCQLQMIK